MHQRQEAMKTGQLKHILLAALLLAISTIGFAQNNCLWLNNATAAGTLNAPVNLKMQNRSDGGTACLFQAQKSDMVNLSITVYEMKDAMEYRMLYRSHCASPVAALRAIGNEAEICAAGIGRSRREKVVGRVRNAAFIVRINTGSDDGLSPNRKLLQKKMEGISEQVAGSLY
jgi:hypothetical protein